MASYRIQRSAKNPVKADDSASIPPTNASRYDWAAHANASGITPEQTRAVLHLVFDLERALWLLQELPESDTTALAIRGLEEAQFECFCNVLWNNVDVLASLYDGK